MVSFHKDYVSKHNFTSLPRQTKDNSEAHLFAPSEHSPIPATESIQPNQNQQRFSATGNRNHLLSYLKIVHRTGSGWRQ